VLTLVGRGLPDKQVARLLGIREVTVKAHLTSVFQRIPRPDLGGALGQANLPRPPAG
jgi:FixJ family two-component response regulator